MHIQAITLDPLFPPKDDLHSKMFLKARLLKEGDIVAITSKVVSIHEGRCVPIDTVFRKDDLAIREAQAYLPRHHSPGGHALHTITQGLLIRSAGIDESNGAGHYILWPKNPRQSARSLLQFLKKASRIRKLGVVITDSISTPLRRGAIGFALAYAGFNPFRDYRGSADIFGRELRFSQANVADAVAAAAVLAMGEGNEQTPVAIIRGVPHVFTAQKSTGVHVTFEVSLEEDLFAPFLTSVPWKKGGAREMKRKRR